MGTVLSRGEKQSIVRSKVQELLGASRAYQSLPSAERARIFADTSAVVERLAAGGGSPPGVDAEQPDDPWARPLDAISPPPTTTTTGSTTDFGAGIEKGVQQAGQILREVNFPDFVSSLIKGVFQAIVDASIQQMKAY